MINICSQVCCEEIMEPFRGLKRTTSQKSMSPFGRGGRDDNCEVFDRQGSAARRLLRQESEVANLLVSKLLLSHSLILYSSMREGLHNLLSHSY